MNDLPQMDLPPLPTMGVGSYAAPGWFVASWRAARKDGWGSHDIQELFEDATRVVVDDQQEVGVDIISDGELRRQRFVYEMFDRLSGLERVAPIRRLGIGGYDMAPHFNVTGKIEAKGSLGAVEEFEQLKAMVPDARLKVAIPGPLTFAQAIELNGHSRDGLMDQLVGVVNDEVKALVEAGAVLVQLDEPGLPRAPHGLSLIEAADVISQALDGVHAQTAVHVCFGNNAGRPFADRRIAPLMDAIGTLRCDVLMFEFANREMADVELMESLATDFIIAAGVIDVKNFTVEDSDVVAERIGQCLDHVPADRLWITADCGFSALPRYIAKQKLAAMTAGTQAARATL